MLQHRQLDIEESAEIRLEPLYSVVLWDDSINTLMAAVRAVQTVFRYDYGVCLQLTWIAHRHGCSVVQRGLSYEVAEHRRNGLRSLGFLASMVPSE